jgi:radical SAM family uncharacterized protein/radical SAM-linked protein
MPVAEEKKASPGLWERIEKVLPFVTKPGRYIGNELNIIRKDSADVKVQVALAFPDVYESGVPNLGLAILYHLINRSPDCLAERTFLPWPDMEKKMREAGIPLFTLESFRSVKDFDVLGITLQYELCYTNVLALLSLAGIPIHSGKRGEEDPLVIAGGHCAGNPEPMAPFFDAFVIGDGEEVAFEILDVIKEAKTQGLPREERLRRFASIPGIYVPAFYEPAYEGEEKFLGLKPKIQGVPSVIEARRVQSLKESDYPDKPLVPLIETTHDRLAIEILRGCTRGCRFCQAGMVTRPVRERSTAEILKIAQAGIQATGWDEVSLLSLSTTDHSTLRQIVENLNKVFAEQRVAVSVPSLRADTFSLELARSLREIKKGGLTFAPEAGTQRLRDVINKGMSEEDLVRSAEAAFEAGWTHLKLYFMLGLPTETDEDLVAIADLIIRMQKAGKRFGGKTCKVSLSAFVPKPHTPFEAEEQIPWPEVERRLKLIMKALPRASSKLTWHDPRQSMVEGALARGDRMISEVIEKAWKLGAQFDEWSEHFSFDRWEQAFMETGLSMQTYLRARESEEQLPWGHISYGPSRGFLKDDLALGRKGQVVEDCRTGNCYACGLPCEPSPPVVREANLSSEQSSSKEYGRTRKPLAQLSPLIKFHLRLRYGKGSEVRFISHLDLMRVFTRAIRRTGLPIAYSQGFSPHQRIALGPPLPLGMTSRAEYMDLEFSRPIYGDLLEKLNRVLPEGIRVLEAKSIFAKVTSLTVSINYAEYEVDLLEKRPALETEITELLSLDRLPIIRSGADGDRVVNIRPLIEEIVLSAEGRCLRMCLQVGEGGSGRVPEVLRALGFAPEEALIFPCERTNLWVKEAGGLHTPMEGY